MSDSVYLTLAAAGAPKLPDEYFYRVSITGSYNDMVDVEVRKHRAVGSKCVARKSGIIPEKDVHVSRDEAEECAKMIVVALCRKAWEDVQRSRSVDEYLLAFTSLEGNHP